MNSFYNDVEVVTSSQHRFGMNKGFDEQSVSVYHLQIWLDNDIVEKRLHWRKMKYSLNYTRHQIFLTQISYRARNVNSFLPILMADYGEIFIFSTILFHYSYIGTASNRSQYQLHEHKNIRLISNLSQSHTPCFSRRKSSTSISKQYSTRNLRALLGSAISVAK